MHAAQTLAKPPVQGGIAAPKVDEEISYTVKTFPNETKIDLFDKDCIVDGIKGIPRGDPDFFTYRNLGIVSDVKKPRFSLPSVYNFKLNFSVIVQLARKIVGKDLSSFQLPVFMHEPLSELQKAGEFMYLQSQDLRRARQLQDPAIRMAYVAMS